MTYNVVINICRDRNREIQIQNAVKSKTERSENENPRHGYKIISYSDSII